MATLLRRAAPDSEEIAPEDDDIEEAIADDTQALPDFAAMFDVNTTLPAPKDPAWKGYMLNLPEPIYRRHPALNITALKPITQAEILHKMQHPGLMDKEAQAIGTAAHWACLEQWRFAEWEKHMLLCDTKTLSSQKAEKQRLQNPGKLLVTPKILQTAHECLMAVRANDDAMALLSGLDPWNPHSQKCDVAKEASGVVWDGKAGIWKKWRVDFMPKRHLILGDVKTTRVHPSQWKWEAIKMGYIDQAVYYTHCHYLLTGEWRDWCWLILTKTPPYMCRVVIMRNLKKSDPLYEDSQWRFARERLGLDDSLRLGKIPQFVNSARETLQLVAEGNELTPARLRKCWPAYESESPLMEIL